MIYYFSGTGNTKHVAKKLAEQMREEAVDIAKYSRTGERLVAKEERLVFLTPIYSSYIPKFFEKLIREGTFSENAKVWFVLTCGAGISAYGMGGKLQKLCAEKHLTYMGLEKAVMPENYITLFFAPKPSTAKKIVAEADEKLPQIAEKIKAEKMLKKGLPFGIGIGIINPIFYKLLVHDRLFTANEKCIGCGLCAKVCPLDNIRLTDGKPNWQGNCTQCQACICRCPKEAIEFGRRSKGKRRYYWEDGR